MSEVTDRQFDKSTGGQVDRLTGRQVGGSERNAHACKTLTGRKVPVTVK